MPTAFSVMLILEPLMTPLALSKACIAPEQVASPASKKTSVSPAVTAVPSK